MKKILEICLSPDKGGLELSMVKTAHHLNAFSVLGNKTSLEDYYKNTSHPYTKIGRLSFIKLAKIIDVQHIDVVHLHWTKDLPVVVLAKLLSTRKPKIVQTRNMAMTRFKSDFYHKFIYKNIDMMIAVTQQVKTQLEKFIPADIRPKIEVLYIGADQPEPLSKKEKQQLKQQLGITDEFIVGIVGRIEPTKGQHILLKAIQQLRNQGLNMKALVVGHAMNDAYLTQLKTEYKDSAIFTGFTTAVPAHMQICNVLVLATRHETFGLVLIEAMRCGICVVGSDSGGPLEIIDHEKTGLLFKTFDSDDLADKLKYLCNTPEALQSLATLGKNKADDIFDSQKQFDKLTALLETL